MKSPTQFDAAYFERFYFDRRTKVVTRKEMSTRAELIAAILRDAQHPINSILDAGCGIGMLKPAFARVLKRARYVGLDASEYLCRRFGWILGSVADFRPAKPFDLVVCYDVLQYLDDRAATRAMANLGRLSRVALYFSALTIEDWRRNCDRSRTDRDVTMRSAAWYRARLQRNFYFLGLGVWIRKTKPTVRWALESCSDC
jgi:SAM-dependent methyltransferase